MFIIARKRLFCTLSRFKLLQVELMDQGSSVPWAKMFIYATLPKSHIIHCSWATKEDPYDLNVGNINMSVKMLQCIDTI